MAAARVSLEDDVAEVISVDAEGLLRAVPAVRALGERAGGVGSALAGQLTAAGPVWGDDAVGQAFAAAYLPAADDLVRALLGMRDVLLSTADGLETMARGYARTEEQNRAAVGGRSPLA